MINFFNFGNLRVKGILKNIVISLKMIVSFMTIKSSGWDFKIPSRSGGNMELKKAYKAYVLFQTPSYLHAKLISFKTVLT